MWTWRDEELRQEQLKPKKVVELCCKGTESDCRCSGCCPELYHNKTSKQDCPICGEGKLTEVERSNQVEYRGISTTLPLHYSVCDYCGCEQADPRQMRLNKNHMVNFRKLVDAAVDDE